MRIFLIINLLIAIISSYEYRIKNNCAWPDDCYITMKFTKTCAIESATAQKANRSKATEEQIRKMDQNNNNALHCLGFPKESMIRCYNRCQNGPIIATMNIPENHMYLYDSNIFEKHLAKYKTLSSSSSFRVEDFGYGKVEGKDKNEEYAFWKDCVFKGLNSTGMPTRKESKAPVKLSLKCDYDEAFCLTVIEYTLGGIKSITTSKLDVNVDKQVFDFYQKNTHSCRIYEKTVECICMMSTLRCESFDRLIESIYLLGRDVRIRGKDLEISNRNDTELRENIPKVLEILQKFRTNYPNDIYGAKTLDCDAGNSCLGYCTFGFKISKNCDKLGQVNPMFPVQTRSFISPHRFIDFEKAGSVALEVQLKSGQLFVIVYCRMGCFIDDSLYASIVNVLSRQMETEDDIIRFAPDIHTEDREEYMTCVYYSFRNEILKSMYEEYDISSWQPETVRETLKPNEILSLIISTILASTIVVLILSIMVIGTISYFRSQTKKEQPITFSKKTVIARRKKPTGKSSELVNSKDKTGDFYDCVSKTTSSTVNHTDLASSIEKTRSRE